MRLTRRAFNRGGAAAVAAALLPTPPRAANLVLVRRSVADLMREKSALLDSYRRAVDVMMQRDITDKTSWWFQANIYDVTEAAITGPVKPLAKYWRQCPRRSYFFLSWQRMYLYFFERIARRAAGDPIFALPYWAYDDPQQSALPAAFGPAEDEAGLPPSARSNALARAKRLAQVESGSIGLGAIAADIKAALSLDRFTAAGVLDAGRSLGGVRVADRRQTAAAGGIERVCNRVHTAIGRDGDMGSPTTAARDPIFWLHRANIDRLWVKWTDPESGRVPPLDDDAWMKTAFTFVDENGDDRTMTGAELLDTQHQLGYRYDDDPPRGLRLTMEPPSRGTRDAPPEPIVLARGRGIELSARESHLVLNPVARPRLQPKRKSAAKGAPPSQRMHLVLKEVTAGDRTPPYDVFLVLEGPSVFQASTTAAHVGALDLFGGAGNSRNEPDGETIAFDASAAIATLSKVRGYNLWHLRVSIVRRPLADASGAEVVPADPSPPTIGAVELVQQA